MSGSRAGGRLERVERGPHAPSPIAWTDRRDPGGGGLRRERREPLRRRDEDAALRAGRERPPLLRLDRLEERRRPRRERPVGEELQPAEIGRGRPSGQSGSPLRSPAAVAASSCSSRMQAWTRMRQRRRARRAPGTRRSRRRGPPGATAPPGSWTATTPSRTRSRGELPRSASRSARAAPAGTWSVTSRAAVSWRTPLGSPPSSRRMRPPSGSTVSRLDRRRPRAPRGSPRASGDRGPRARRAGRARPRSRSSAVGQRPSGPWSQPWPSSQRSPSGRASPAAADRGQAAVERRGLRQVDLVAGDAALGEVEMGVGQARDRDLVGVELEPDGERVGPRLELDRRAGERDAAVG